MNKYIKWTPSEIRKTIVLIVGILLAITGIILIIYNVQAEGSVSIDMNILKGEIKSGSAGLLLLFFSFFLISLSMMNLNVSRKKLVREKTETREIKPANKVLILLIGLVLLSIVLILIDNFLLIESVLIPFSIMLFVISLVLVFVYIDLLNE